MFSSSPHTRWSKEKYDENPHINENRERSRLEKKIQREIYKDARTRTRTRKKKITRNKGAVIRWKIYTNDNENVPRFHLFVKKNNSRRFHVFANILSGFRLAL